MDEAVGKRRAELQRLERSEHLVRRQLLGEEITEDRGETHHFAMMRRESVARDADRLQRRDFLRQVQLLEGQGLHAVDDQ